MTTRQHDILMGVFIVGCMVTGFLLQDKKHVDKKHLVKTPPIKARPVIEEGTCLRNENGLFSVIRKNASRQLFLRGIERLPQMRIFGPLCFSPSERVILEEDPSFQPIDCTMAMEIMKEFGEKGLLCKVQKV